MYSKILLVLASSFIAVTISTNNDTTWNRLETRAGQQLTNPDNEPQYQDPTSGNWVDKSKVLSGVGPAAAASRFFDWDETCTDATEREKIVLAWNDFQDLTVSTSRRLIALRDRLPQQPVGTGGSPNAENRRFIFAEDPAYTQMFKAADIRIEYVRESFDLITANVKRFPGRGGNGPAALRFICDVGSLIGNGQGAPLCGTGADEAEAVTTVPQGPLDLNIDPSHRFSTASSITFCRKFFDNGLLPSIFSVWESKQIVPDLNTVDCRERVMLHEYLHLPWTRDMDPTHQNDVHGYLKAALAALRFRWDLLQKIPDCYAWYALYSAYNNEHTGCGRDIWPKGVTKPIKG